MAVQPIFKKKITKYDLNDPNLIIKDEKDEKPVVNGNLKKDYDDDIYGENKHTYQPDNGNLQMNEFMTGVLNKLDGLTVNPDIVEKNRAVEVDVKRSIAIGKADLSDLKSAYN